MTMIRHLVCLSLVLGVSFSQDNGNLDDLINSLFTSESPNVVASTPSPTTTTEAPEKLPPGVPEADNCPSGECVPYYLCLNGTFITDGEGLIDIRFSDEEPKSCYDYMETCCAEESKTTEPIFQPSVKRDGCGNRYVKGISFKISDKNSEAQYGEFPWMVAVLREEQAAEQTLNVYQCGGSLIHTNVVLTAAHCVAGKEPTIFKIRAGEWDTQTKTEIWPHQDRQVSEYIVHEQYYKGGLHNDIALLFFKEPVTIAENVQTACLPPQGFVFDGSRCAASGWGKDVFGREGKYQVILKKIELPIVPHATCEDSLRRTRLAKRFNLHESFICAGGEPGEDTCKGDGGSPLVCPIPGTIDRYYQAGIVAWGIGCGENQVPGVYVNVPLFRNWIDSQFNARNLDRSYYNV